MTASADYPVLSFLSARIRRTSLHFMPGAAAERTITLKLVGGKLLRCGYTTGSCAAAAAKAAAVMLLTQNACRTVWLKTPGKTVLTLDVSDCEYTPEYASCAVRKDSGDDPDVTNGCLVYARVSLAPEGIEITGGEGIGRVTKPGLDQPVGAFAINSVPRLMIYEECKSVCEEYGYTGGLSIVIYIPGGEALAERTFNSRLGIEGGLSVLGTTGIVEPMSENAIIQTIRTELNVLYEAGKRDVLFTIGNYGEAFARDILRLSAESHIKCSNFIGEALSAAVETGFSGALLVGHIGKLSKLGIGVVNTHSRHGDGRIEAILSCALEAGASLSLLHKIRECVTADAALACLREEDLFHKAMALLREKISDTLLRHTAAHLQIGFVCFYGLGDGAALCFQNETAEKMLEVFAQ